MYVCRRALRPMDEYVETLTDFKELIAIDINDYVNEAQNKFFPANSEVNTCVCVYVCIYLCITHQLIMYVGDEYDGALRPREKTCPGQRADLLPGPDTYIHTYM